MTSDEHEIRQAPAEAFPLTLAHCHEVIVALTGHNALLLQRLADHEKQIAVLQERLKLDSKNSSKPPSSDGPASGNRAQRRASACKRGAQLGSQGQLSRAGR